MLRADYNSIIYAYEAFEKELWEIDGYDPAVEAETGGGSGTVGATTAAAATGTSTQTSTTSGTASAATGLNANGSKPDEINAKAAATSQVKPQEQDSAKKQEKFQKALEAVRNFMKKIATLLQQAKRWIESRIRAMQGNDRSFQNQYEKQRQLVKPHHEVVVINYSYNNAKLEDPMKGLMKDMQDCLRTLAFTNGATNASGRVSEIINAPQGKMLEKLFEPYSRNAQDPVTSATLFIRHLLIEYRGEKAERKYNESQIPAIEKNAMATADITGRCQAYLNDCTRLFNNVKQLEKQLTPNTDEKVITMVKENARKAAVLYNSYSSLIHMYFEVRLEQSMNYRIILKRFYQM